MARKLTFGLALLALTLVVTGSSFANGIPTVVVFGPATTGTITVSTVRRQFREFPVRLTRELRQECFISAERQVALRPAI